MQGVNTCHFIDPGFCQPACVAPKTRICHPLCYFISHAGSQTLAFARAGMHWSNPCGLSGCTVHLCSYETSRGFTCAHAKRSQRHLRSKASPRKNLEQHNASREHLQWLQQWPWFMVYAGGQALSFYRPWFLPTHMCHPQNPHLSPLVPFYGVCRGSGPVIL